MSVGALVWAPLEGITVIDFSAQLPGPLASAILADLGADVIKVEPPGGEFARRMPTGLFERMNRSKRSMTLDLKSPASGTVIERLAAKADVVLETFRPGVAHRIGIGPETFRAMNARIVYCSLSGYGQDGPWRDRPGHDLAYLAAAGAMSLRGQWNEPPRRSALPVGDISGGAFAANAIMAALFERERTGTGRVLDLSLYEAAIYGTATRTAFDDEGNGRMHLLPTNDLFETADGRMLAVTIVEEHFWTEFVAIARASDPELADARFATADLRHRNGDELYDRLIRLFRRRTAQEWMQVFEGTDVPAEICLTPREAARTEQIAARALLLDGGAQKKFCPFPVKVDGARRPSPFFSPAPAVGEHATQILNELGFTLVQINELATAGAIVRE